MNPRFAIFLVCAAGLSAQTADVVLPELAIFSPRVANQAPVASFAMPVTALRFEPRVDVQVRNFAESQADVTIRGGIFENTGFRVGAVSLFDPQTGHYFAEIPVAPGMLGAPEILTGAELAMSSTNATAGAVAYSWRKIKTGGVASIGAGDFGLLQGALYQGYVSPEKIAGRTLAADAAWAHSDADGAIPNGDHRFNRVNARIQLTGATSQTDLFAGYQAKFLGWPNMYTPFNSNESEDLENVLVVLNHRADFGGGDFLEAGAYYRRNKDDYAFNRFAPVGPIPPFNHTTWVESAAVSGRNTLGETALNYRGEILSDKLRSTSLTFGRYHTRDITKLALVPERTWSLNDGAILRVKAGATYDDTNRDSSAVSPVFEVGREQQSSPIQRVYFSYAETTQVATYTALNSNSAAGLFRGNQNLGRESSHNFEVGLSGTALGWTGQAAVFYRRDDDLIDWTFKRGVIARTANAVNTDTTGFELVARRSWTMVDLVLGATWLDKGFDYKGAAVDASFYALNYARQRWTAAITLRLTPEFEVRMDNEFRIQAANLLRTTGGNDAVLSSIGVTYRPRALPRVSVTVQVENLWESEFQEVPAVPASPRQVAAVLTYVW